MEPGQVSWGVPGGSAAFEGPDTCLLGSCTFPACSPHPGEFWLHVPSHSRAPGSQPPGQQPPEHSGHRIRTSALQIRASLATPHACHNMVALDPAEQLHVRYLNALGTLISMAQMGRMAAWATSTLGRLRSGPRAPDPTLPRAPGPQASPRPSRWVLLLRLPGVGPVGRQQFSPCSLPLG